MITIRKANDSNGSSVVKYEVLVDGAVICDYNHNEIDGVVMCLFNAANAVERKAWDDLNLIDLGKKHGHKGEIPA